MIQISQIKLGTAGLVAMSENIFNTIMGFISGYGVITLKNLLETKPETVEAAYF